MNNTYISKTNIKLNNSTSQVWEVLTNKTIASKYFHGAEVITDWSENNPIIFKGEYHGNQYEEKGIILKVVHESLLQYSHWSPFDSLPDLSENYRIWSFQISKEESFTILSISEDNIPNQKKKERSDEFWTEVLNTIKQILE